MREDLRKLARALPPEAGPQVEARLLLAFRARRKRSLPRWTYAAAAAIIAGGIYWAGWASGHSQERLPARAAYGSAPEGFIALPYSQSGVPLENPVIVRMDIHVSELGSFGVPANAIRGGGWVAGGERVRADLLVGQDGVARAVRFVQ